MNAAMPADSMAGTTTTTRCSTRFAACVNLTIGDSRSDVRRLLEHALHDSLHHLADVERGLAALRAQPS
jgi:hypothetical protein